MGDVRPELSCQHCGKPAYGRFCSYACWRIAQGLPVPGPDQRTVDSVSDSFEAAIVSPEALIVSPAGCMACGGTRTNSKGGPCVPCLKRADPPACDAPAPWEESDQVEVNDFTSTAEEGQRPSVGQLSLF